MIPSHPQLKKNIPDLRSGDRVKVHQKVKEGGKERIQIFEGLVIKTQHGRGIGGTFTVRRLASGVGVEKTFPLHLPSIVKIEKVKSAKVRRAKLYYVRNFAGRSARRLKGEKEDRAEWEDIIEKPTPKPTDETSAEPETGLEPNESQKEKVKT